MPGLMGMKHIMAFNDEAHHCYREKPEQDSDEGKLTGDDRKEAEKSQASGAGLDLGTGGGAASSA